MNIALLILGVFFITLSIILITINSNNTYESNTKVEVEKEIHPLKVSIKKNIEIEDEYSNSFETDIKGDYYKEKEIESKDIKFIKSKEIEELEEFEEEYKLEKTNIGSNGENITNEIIKMYKEGLRSNEIAEKLGKGIREIDIILKVNNINE